MSSDVAPRSLTSPSPKPTAVSCRCVRSWLEALRLSLESDGWACPRQRRPVTYPAHFQFVAAMNPCDCKDAMNSKRAW